MKRFIIPVFVAVLGILLAACKPPNQSETKQTSWRGGEVASSTEFTIDSSGEAKVGSEENESSATFPDDEPAFRYSGHPTFEATDDEQREAETKYKAGEYLGVRVPENKLPAVGETIKFWSPTAGKSYSGVVIGRSTDGTKAILTDTFSSEPESLPERLGYPIVLDTQAPPVFTANPAPLTEESQVAVQAPVLVATPPPATTTPPSRTAPPSTRIGGQPIISQRTVTEEALRAIVTTTRETLRTNIDTTLQGSPAGRNRLHAQINSAAQKHNERTRAVIGKLPGLGSPGPDGERPPRSGTLGGEFEAMGAYRNYAKQFLNDRTRDLWEISEGTLSEAEKRADAGDIDGARNRLQSVRQVTGAIINSHLLPPPNESPDMDTPTRMRTRSLHAGTDLLDAANQFDRDGLVGIADKSREGGGKLLNIALGIARFSGAADIPISLIEMVSGKTPEFDDAGNLTLVEVDLLDRSIATLVVGATVAGTVFTGPGGVAVGTGVSKVLHGTKALISGVVKSQLVRKFLRQAGHALVGCTLLTPVSPPNPFEQLLGVERAHASGPCQTAKELAEGAASTIGKHIDDIDRIESTWKGADEWEKTLKNLPVGERVAQIKPVAAVKAQKNGWRKNRQLTKKNKRDVYTDDDGIHWALDTEKGRWEKCDKKGRHQGEFDFDGIQKEQPDATGGHNLII